MKRVFVDTNIFAYAFDLSADVKRQRADQAIASLHDADFSPWISTQVLQEYYNVLTRKFGFSAARAKSELIVLCALPTVIMTPDIIQAAADISATASVSFWDALIVAAAQHAACDELWSEDLQSGRSFGHLRIVNPFAGI
jgi:predicted nucleic acid-binding protein